MKRKVERRVWIELDEDGEVSEFYMRYTHSGCIEGVVSFEVDEPEQTVTITESEAEAAFVHKDLSAYKFILGFK